MLGRVPSIVSDLRVVPVRQKTRQSTVQHTREWEGKGAANQTKTLPQFPPKPKTTQTANPDNRVQKGRGVPCRFKGTARWHQRCRPCLDTRGPRPTDQMRLMRLVLLALSLSLPSRCVAADFGAFDLMRWPFHSVISTSSFRRG